MKALCLLLLTLVLLPNSSYASVQAFDSSGAEIGQFTKIKCGTGMTCAQTAGKLEMIASSLLMANGETLVNSTDDVIQVTSNDEHMTFKVLGFEAKDAILALFADEGDDNADKFQFKYSAAGALTFEVNASAIATMTGSSGAFALTGALTGDGGDALYGFLKNQVASTTTALTIAQCGSTIVSNSADVMTLPEASTALGCRYTFVCGTADDLDVNPSDGTDQISVVNSVAGGTGAAITPSAGDAIRCTDIGSSIVLEAVAADLWVTIGVGNGAWTDVN
jgi:hypothetical protein